MRYVEEEEEEGAASSAMVGPVAVVIEAAVTPLVELPSGRGAGAFEPSASPSSA